MIPLRSKRCGAPLPTGGECQRREIHVNGKCAKHGGEGELARIVRKQEKTVRQRKALVASAERFLTQMRAAGVLRKKDEGPVR